MESSTWQGIAELATAVGGVVYLAVARSELYSTFGPADGYNESNEGVVDSIKGGAIHWIQHQTVDMDQSPIATAMELSVSPHQSRVMRPSALQSASESRWNAQMWSLAIGSSFHQFLSSLRELRRAMFFCFFFNLSCIIPHVWKLITFPGLRRIKKTSDKSLGNAQRY